MRHRTFIELVKAAFQKKAKKQSLEQKIRASDCSMTVNVEQIHKDEGKKTRGSGNVVLWYNS